MEITPIGYACFLAAAIILARPMTSGLIVFGVFLPLQTAAAINIWSAGGLSIICSHLLVGALLLAVAIRPRLFASVLRGAVSKPATAFLGVFVLYAIASAFFLPRLFEGEVHVYSLERPPPGTYGIPLTTLHPSSGNITQSFYMAVNFLLFALFVHALGRAEGLRRATRLINAVVIVHIAFAALNLAPEIAPVKAALDFVRTANYSILAGSSMAGLRRIIGSYAEASAFGAMSMGLFAWSFLRFLQTRGLWYFCASVLLLGCIVLSFSTTAYAVMGLLILLWALHTIYKLVRGGLSADQLTALFTSTIAAIVLILFLFYEPMRLLALELFERLFGAKFESASGIERSAWNSQGLRNFADTLGLGVGLGSARTSSLATALLSNVGLIGAALFMAFLASSFLRPWRRRLGEAEDRDAVYARRLFVAARAGGLALLISHLIAGGNIDGGLLFYVFAAIATAAYLPAAQTARRSFGVPRSQTSLPAAITGTTAG